MLYLDIDIGGHLRMNGLRAFFAQWLDVSQINRYVGKTIESLCPVSRWETLCLHYANI